MGCDATRRCRRVSWGDLSFAGVRLSCVAFRQVAQAAKTGDLPAFDADGFCLACPYRELSSRAESVILWSSLWLI